MSDDLQFNHAESASSEQTGPVSCKSCGGALSDTYYVVNGHILCEHCRRAIEVEWDRGGAAGRFGKAIGLGLLATIGCSLVWYLVLKGTDSQWGILAVVVGLVIGGAVRKGSNGRGGWRYQALAVFLTYTAIVSSYVPFMIEGMRDQSAQVANVAPGADSLTETSAANSSTTSREIGPFALALGVVVLLAILYATPFLAGIENLIGVLIIGFALYEAWKLNRRAELHVSGPHRVSITSTPTSTPLPS